jgi:predicted transcriptional regulator
MAEALRPNREFTVVVLLEAIRRETVNRTHNGDTTEHRLAKMIGISQPQMHNVLKGSRTPKPEIADLLIAQLGIPVVNLDTGVG